MPRNFPVRRTVVWTILGASLFAILLIRTAWCSEDAFIGFRVADNFLHGQGLTWNPGERVQVFTDPLFEFFLIAVASVTRNDYWSAITVSFLLSLATYFLLLRGRTGPAIFLGTSLLMLSKGFMDFSISGLENPATHFAVAAYAWAYWHRRDPLQLTLIASLAAVNRLDSILLFAPSLLWVFYKEGWRVWKPVLLGALPLLAWEAFSLFYFGFPFPNTAYAKLHNSLPPAEIVFQGIRYFETSIAWDTVTALVIVGGVMVGFLQNEWPLALGIVFSVGYVTAIGGDYMLSRFLTPAFVLGCAILVQHAATRRKETIALAGFALFFGLLIPSPTLRTTRDFGVVPAPPVQESHGIGDERSVWYHSTGLLRWKASPAWPEDEWHRDGLKLQASGKRFAYIEPAGLIPYFAGPQVYILDQAALGDALMAHVPLRTSTTRPGHNWRDPPPGYLETLESGQIRIQDKNLAEYYGHLRHIIRGRLWDSSRWGEIVAMNLGIYNHLLHQP